jgi:uncharacterized membrane protein YhaH (DUF805 family)
MQEVSGSIPLGSTTFQGVPPPCRRNVVDMSILDGRMDRRGFLSAYLSFVAAKIALLLATQNALLVDAAALVPWVWMATKRLHDFNARWWWSLLPFVVGFATGLVNGFCRPPNLRSS